MRNWKNGKCMVACNCKPFRTGYDNFCTGCVENHKDSKKYESMKELRDETNKIFASLFS